MEFKYISLTDFFFLKISLRNEKNKQHKQLKETSSVSNIKAPTVEEVDLLLDHDEQRSQVFRVQYKVFFFHNVSQISRDEVTTEYNKA